MIEIVSIILLFIITITLKIILNVKFKELNKLSKEKQLDYLTERLPENEKICKEILKKLNNETVKINKSLDENSQTSLYMVWGNKIILANNNKSYARVQTVAHECLHSIQSKKMLWFNYVFSNFYIIYTAVVLILTITGIIKNSLLQLYILSILGLVFYVVRSFLEIDAMTKAKFLAVDYLESTEKYNKEEINILKNEYEKINKIGIPTTCFVLAFNVIKKLLIYSVVAIILLIVKSL